MAAVGPLQVFLLGGQSNMVGSGSRLALTPPLSNPQDDVQFFYYAGRGSSPHPPDGGLRSLAPDSGTDVFRFGPEVSFGRAMADAFPSRRLALVKYANGGTDLRSHWNPDSTGNQGVPDFDGRVTTFANFQKTVADGLDSLGEAYEIAGMLWFQGERDTIHLPNAEAYQANLEAFITEIRARYGANLPFLIAAIRELDAADTVVVEAQRAVAASDPFTTFLPVDGLENRDDLHLAASGLVSVGRGYAAAYASFQTPDEKLLFIDTGDRGDGTAGRSTDGDALEDVLGENSDGSATLRVHRNASGHAIAYLRYDLSLADATMQTASLELFALQGAGTNVTVYGLNDGDVDEDWSAAALDYDAGVGLLGSDSNLETSEVDADESVQPENSRARALGTFFVPDVGPVVFSGAGLANFLRADADGVVTLLLEMETGNAGQQLAFTSAEGVGSDADDFAPTLVLSYATWECNDGLDNDADGATDFPADPGCDSDVGLSED